MFGKTAFVVKVRSPLVPASPRIPAKKPYSDIPSRGSSPYTATVCVWCSCSYPVPRADMDLRIPAHIRHRKQCIRRHSHSGRYSTLSSPGRCRYHLGISQYLRRTDHLARLRCKRLLDSAEGLVLVICCIAEIACAAKLCCCGFGIELKFGDSRSARRRERIIARKTLVSVRIGRADAEKIGRYRDQGSGSRRYAEVVESPVFRTPQ